MGSMKEPTIDLYETDFHAWTVDQAEKLRKGDLKSLDLVHLTEEIESLGRSEKRELQSRLAQLLMHLLKWECQALIRSRSWVDTIREQRRQLEFLLEEMPSLRPKVGDFLPRAYSDARLMAERETGLPISTFPVDCPYAAAQSDRWCVAATGRRLISVRNPYKTAQGLGVTACAATPRVFSLSAGRR